MKQRELNIIYKTLNEIKPYEKNPRHNDDAVKYVKNSIKKFGFKVPIVIDKNNVIVAGHTRYKASLELGLEKVPCIVADDLTEKQIKAFRLADNKAAEKASWDFDLLNDELTELNIDFDMSEFGFDVDITEDEEEEEEEDNSGDKYTMDVKAPIYEITGDCPNLSELVDTSKTDELKAEIEKADIEEDVKEFLMLSAERHTAFDYSKIAEYYAHVSKEIQELMEKSALVIIDFDKSIEYGFTKLSKRIEAMRGSDYDEEE